MFFFRFNDIHVPVRLECVKFASHCLMNHPDLARDLTGALFACVLEFLPQCLFHSPLIQSFLPHDHLIINVG